MASKRTKIDDPDVEARLIQALKTGNYRETACKYAGVGVSTFYRWMEKGEADHEAEKDSRERDVWEAVKKAEAEAEVQAVALIRKAMPDSWQAAMTYLERKYPSKWGRSQRVELTGREGGPLEIVPVQRQGADVLALLDRTRALPEG